MTSRVILRYARFFGVNDDNLFIRVTEDFAKSGVWKPLSTAMFHNMDMNGEGLSLSRSGLHTISAWESTQHMLEPLSMQWTRTATARSPWKSS